MKLSLTPQCRCRYDFENKPINDHLLHERKTFDLRCAGFLPSLVKHRPPLLAFCRSHRLERLGLTKDEYAPASESPT